MTENEFLLQDRLGVIRDTINKYGEENFYLSFSGGKDSTVVHHLLDMALPGNRIPRVFINTGIEYNDIVLFAKKMAKEDDRFEILLPKQNIKQMLERVGYPFKSKEHALKVMEYQKTRRITPHLQRYLDKSDGKRLQFKCPNILEYQFTDEFNLKVSLLCCTELKKKPVHEWEKEHGRAIALTVMRAEEGGVRKQLGCIMTKKGKVHRFNPLIKVNDEWEEWFIDTYNVEICKLYYPPYNFERTGCKGCPFNPLLEKDLLTMEICGMNNERKQAEYLWKPVYDEYRRIGYRLKKEEQLKLL